MYLINSLKIILCTFILNFFTNANAQEVFTSDLLNSSQKPIKILVIDGGGIKGIIPLMVLKDIESKLKNHKNLAECFDIMVGSSTGGIIALGLNANIDLQAKYKVQKILDLYKNNGADIFNSDMLHNIYSVNGYFAPKYKTDKFEEMLKNLFGEQYISESISKLMVLTYDIEQAKTIFFRSSRAKDLASRDVKMSDLARATSAAPTYFSPAAIKSKDGSEYFLVDGGVAANNPVISSFVYALNLYGTDNKFLIVSLGTGENSEKLSYNKIKNKGMIGWGEVIVPIMMDATNDVNNYIMRIISLFNKNWLGEFYRFQADIETADSKMDDISTANIEKLQKYGTDIVATHQEQINRIVQIIDKQY